MKRDITQELLAWKEQPNRKPLVLKGVRQCGKTYILKKFGREYYKDVAYFNFEETRSLNSLFEQDYDVKRILFELGLFLGRTITPGNTLIILDEIQECPRAITALKYFCENAPEYHVTCAGSLLGLAIHENQSFPVGKVDIRTLYPMSFYEFLSATGDEALADYLTCFQPGSSVSELIGGKLRTALKQYYVVGGMPEAVRLFSENRNFAEARSVQKSLLVFYQQDFSKHAEARLTERLNQVWNCIPAQLARENRKFIYGQVRKGARAKDFELAIQWLSDCGLIHVVHRASKPGYPLKAYEDMNAFKIYLLDVGLLGAMADLSSGTIVDGNRIFTEFKGALTEQYVLQELIAEDHLSPMYYSAENSRMEIDFMVQRGSGIIPIEVKAEENLRARSLRTFCEKYKPETAVRFSMSDYREQEWMVNVPLYEINWLND